MAELHLPDVDGGAERAEVLYKEVGTAGSGCWEEPKEEMGEEGH